MTPPARSVNVQGDAPSVEQQALFPPSRGRDGRSLSAASAMPSLRGQSSFAASGPPPGSFSSELRIAGTRTETPRPDFGSFVGFGGEDSETTSEQRQAELQDQIEKETKIKIGSENL